MIAQSYGFLGKNIKSNNILFQVLDHDLEVDSSENIAFDYKEIADNYTTYNLDSAIYFSLKSEKIYLGLQDTFSLGYLYHTFSEIYGQKGDLEKTIFYSNKLFECYEQTKWGEFYYLYYYQRAKHLYNNKDYENSLYYMKKTYDILKKYSYVAGMVEAGNHIGNTFNKLNMPDSAIFYYKKIKYIAKEIKDTAYIAVSDIQIAVAYFEMNQLEKTETYLNLAKQSLRQDNKHSFYRLHKIYGDLYQKQSNYQSALASYQKSLFYLNPGFLDSANVEVNPQTSELSRQPKNVMLLNRKAKTALSLFRSQKKLEYLDLCLETGKLSSNFIDTLQNSYISERSKYNVLEYTDKLFDILITALGYKYRLDSDEKHKHRAFYCSEKSKAVVLSQSIADAKALKNIPNDSLQKEKNLRIEISMLETSIKKAQTEEQVQEFQKRKSQKIMQRAKLKNRLAKQYPEYAASKETKIASIAQIQNDLNSDETLIEYFVGADSLTIFAISKTSFNIKTVAFSDEIIGYWRANVLFSEFETARGYSENTFSLYEKLIQPVKDYIVGNSLIIIPHGAVSLVPFEALVSETSESKKFADLHYLINDYSISYHYTASLWHESRQKNKKHFQGNYSFVGFAPVFTKKTNKYVAGASREFKTEINGSENIEPLPASENEINSISKLFKDKGYSSKKFLHGEASEKKFVENIEGERVVHIATHAKEKPNPRFSFILFSQDNRQIEIESIKPEDDNFLYATETYNLNLDSADLVVLSACETGIGEMQKGEGMLSINRGFLYSGASSIVYSLWSINDLATSEIMVDFYKNIFDGNEKKEALRNAKLNYIKNSKKSNKEKSPRFWAGSIFLGY